MFLRLSWLTAGVVSLAFGCSGVVGPRFPAQSMKDPVLGREYLLFRPARYSRELAWPLIIACPGRFPDSPKAQMEAWGSLAEANGLLLAVPTLASTRARIQQRPERLTARFREDERHLLAVLQHIRAGHQVADDRVFLYAWEEGAPAALYTALRNRELFRAVALASPSFDEAGLQDVAGAVDPYLPIYVHFPVSDAITGKHGRRLADWLRSRGADLRDDSRGPVRHSDTQQALAFFQDVLRRGPKLSLWVLAMPEQPRGYRLGVQSSEPVDAIHWDFGDGDAADLQEPIHVYASAGPHRVKAHIVDSKGREHRRALDLVVP